MFYSIIWYNKLLGGRKFTESCWSGTAVSEGMDSYAWMIQTIYCRFLLFVDFQVSSCTFPPQFTCQQNVPYRHSLTMHADAYPISHQSFLATHISSSQYHYLAAITQLTWLLFWTPGCILCSQHSSLNILYCISTRHYS